MKRSPKEWGYTVKPVPGTKLAPGAIYPPYGRIGHWEVTAKVVEEMGFSAPAAELICAAAQDPDFYDFCTVAAHAQTPDSADRFRSSGAKRTAIIAEAVDAHVAWVDAQFRRCASALEQDDLRAALYWLGYGLHGVEDLAVHAGITNGEHASAAARPDHEAADIALSSVYARRLLDAVRSGLGQEGFDRLRNHSGDGRFGFSEKRQRGIHLRGWDLDDGIGDYSAAGKRYAARKPKPEPVRWDREVVLARVLDRVLERRMAYLKRVRSNPADRSANPRRAFTVLKPLAPLARQAEWAILVYMAGDDRNPEGIEYAVSQDLGEIKQVGSTNAVHFLVQTDDATGKASYRYRLRKGTGLAADRIERFNGDLNTGSTKTLVDFVRWAHHLFPAERTALVLWGHGSGHDDQNVYRAARGAVSPRTAARLAQRRLGFFSGTRRAILEQGPTRGYGYDDTAGDFLDNGELRKALLQVREVLGRRLDILGFDACLMAMIEVAYQIRDCARYLLASERTEPGDGWWYSRALRRVAARPQTTAREFAGEIVAAYRDAYRDDMTLSAIDLAKVPALARRIDGWTEAARPADFHRLRRSALDCSPRPGDGYCDLGSFLDAAADPALTGADRARRARRELSKAVIASCGRTSGLTIYAPGNFRPRAAGSTDALYLGLTFARETAWGRFLKQVYPPLARSAPGVETLPIPTPSTGLDRFNARQVLAAVRSGGREGWLDRLRGDLLGPCGKALASAAKRLDGSDPSGESPPPSGPLRKASHPAAERRILVLPGIMGSLLHDRSGKLGAVWIDPWNLVFGDDFAGLKLSHETGGTAAKAKASVAPLPLPQRIPDADNATQIEACGVVPLIYDRLALALLDEFGPVVEYAPYDWRQPIGYLGAGLAGHLAALIKEHPAVQVALVAHSMGGLVAADALAKLAGSGAPLLDSVKALVVMGTPFRGSLSALQALRAENGAMNLLKLLAGKSPGEVEATVQTFRGLFDLLPGDQEMLVKPALYAPGPLSRLPPGDPWFGSPGALVRDLPPALRERTCAIVCTTRDTVGAAVAREDGAVDYSVRVAGDGTVPADSALNGGTLLPQAREVEQEHMTLPLDGQAIGHAVQWIGRQFGIPPVKSLRRAWPAAPEIRLPGSRAELIRRLEAEEELTLGDFVALLTVV
ncbi:MAG: clostripain-related cysteine peptidase [Syntrophales bacterium]